MLEFLPKELSDGLEAARISKLKRKSRLRVELGGQIFPILRLWHDGLSVDATRTAHLRGLVDIYDGTRHIFQCLIVASTIENGELICDFKRATAVRDAPALDFWRDENTPIAFLSKA